MFAIHLRCQDYSWLHQSKNVQIKISHFSYESNELPVLQVWECQEASFFHLSSVHLVMDEVGFHAETEKIIYRYMRIINRLEDIIVNNQVIRINQVKGLITGL